MSNSGFITRFVDIVLILLFGFISISEITEQSQINLPTSTQTPETKPENQVVSIFIGVKNTGLYLVEGESRSIRGASALRRYLSGLRVRYGSSTLRIRLQSDFDAPIRYTMIAAKACDELGLAKSIDVRLKKES